MKSFVVNKSDLDFNIKEIKEMAGDTKVIAVLKGYGYGLGLCGFANLLRDNDIDFFAVSELDEAIVLRNAGFTEDILLLTATCDEGEIATALENNVTLAIGSALCMETVERIAVEKNVMAKAHIKIDTGFGRFGFLPVDAGSVCEMAKAKKNISFEGIFSHFSFSFSPDRKDVQLQFDRFNECINVFKENGMNLMAHICNSCAFLQYKDMHLDAVRVGSAFLGRLPLVNSYGLKKIGYLKSNVVEVRNIPKGYYVGYANTYKTKRETTIAIVPVGYKDGFGVEKSKDTFRLNDVLRYMFTDFKSLGKRLSVTVNGKTANIIGRVSMYNIVLDVTGMDIKVGDECKLNANPILVSRDIAREYI